MTTRAISVDLETLDVDADATIVSVGAVRFDPYTPEFTALETFYQVLQLDGQGRSMGNDTICFWMKQGDEARNVFQAADKVELEEMLEAFTLFCVTNAADGEADIDKQYVVDEIWAKPAMFDLSILQHAYAQFGETPPWPHRNSRCLRTLQALYPNIPQPDWVGVKHNSLDDALNQARFIHHIMKYR